MKKSGYLFPTFSMPLLVRFVAYAFNILEVLLGLRFFLRIANANPAASIVRFVYDVTDMLLVPFRAIFRPTTVEGSVVEWSTLFAIAAYALLIYALLRFLTIVQSGNTPISEKETEEELP